MPGLESLGVRCRNATAWSAPNNQTHGPSEALPSSTDRQAVLYIVVVLLFYSIGIIVAIIMYLKREKAEMVEEKAYEDYMAFRTDPYKWARYYRMQQVLYRLSHVEEEKRRRDRRRQQDHALAEALRDLEAQERRDESREGLGDEASPGPHEESGNQSTIPTSTSRETHLDPQQTQGLLQETPIGLSLVTCV